MPYKADYSLPVDVKRAEKAEWSKGVSFLNSGRCQGIRWPARNSLYDDTQGADRAVVLLDITACPEREAGAPCWIVRRVCSTIIHSFTC